jgi:hypothetical protein
MDRRRFVKTTEMGTAAGLVGGAATNARAASGTAPARPTDQAPPFADLMRREHVPRSGIALGGLGTGSAELRKDGRFVNWTCFNNEPQFTGPRLAWPQDSILFFLVRWQRPGLSRHRREPARGLRARRIGR